MPSLNTKLASAPNTQANYVLKATSSTTIGNSQIFDSGTFVGINNTTPQAMLDVYIGSVGTYFRGGSDNVARQLKISSSTTTNAGDTHTFDAQSGTGVLAFATTSTERMRITSSGNVGIGISTLPSNVKVKIKATSEGTDIGLSSSTLSIARAASDTQLNIGYYTTPDAFVISSTYGSDGAYKPLAFATSDTERMRITSTGNVGIGTSSPAGSWPLTTKGTYGIVAQASANTSGIYMWHDGTDGLIQTSYETTGGFGAIKFLTSTTERMRITSGGNVLIGTTSSPSAYGLVAIRGTNQGLTIQDAVSNGYRSLYFQSGNLYFYNGTNEGYLSSGGTWVNASDITLKKDVKEIEYGLDSVMQLKPKWYRMIEDDLEQIGFIAQDVEEVVPELVSTSEKGMKGLSYGQLTAVLVKAIQEQQAQIEELKALINK